MQLSASALLSLTVLHYRMVAQLLPVNRSHRRKMIKRLITIQAISIAVGVVFVSMPFVITVKFAYSLSILYALNLDMTSIAYCWKSRKILLAIPTSETIIAINTQRLKKEAIWIQPASALTAILKLIALIVNILPGTIGKISRLALYSLKWASMSYYVSLILLPIIFFVFRKETRDACICCKKIIKATDVTRNNITATKHTTTSIMQDEKICSSARDVTMATAHVCENSEVQENNEVDTSRMEILLSVDAENIHLNEDTNSAA